MCVNNLGPESRIKPQLRNKCDNCHYTLHVGIYGVFTADENFFS